MYIQEQEETLLSMTCHHCCSNLGPFGGLPDGETVASLAVLYAGWFGAQTVQVSGGDVRAILQLVHAANFPLLQAFPAGYWTLRPIAGHPPESSRKHRDDINTTD